MLRLACAVFHPAPARLELRLDAHGGLAVAEARPPLAQQAASLAASTHVLPLGIFEDRNSAVAAYTALVGANAASDATWVAASACNLNPIDAAIAAAGRAALTRFLSRRPVCAIVGCKATSRHFTDEVARRAYAVGREAARAGFAVVTGGLGGVMTEAARGARSVDGLTVGILPGDDPTAANPHVTVVLPSGIGYARNYLVALSADVMVALTGGRGTLEEMCFALDFERTVVGWESWPMDGVGTVNSEGEVETVLYQYLQSRLFKVVN